MKLLDSFAFFKTSFRGQLLLIFATGVSVLAIVASITTAWVTSRDLRTLLIKEGIQVTGNLAEQSVLALLYDSGENAADAARTTLSFPAIQHVTIFNWAHQPILDQGRTDTLPLPEDEIKWIEGEPQLIRDTRRAWHFIAPVYTHESSEIDTEQLFAGVAAERELLGHVYVIMQKDTLRDIEATTFFNNIAIALFIAVVLMLITHLSLSRLTHPLHTLSRLMGRAKQGETEVYASLQGPREVVQIAGAFNKMMESLAERDRRLRQQNLRLESEVSLRTRELVHARDAALEASRHKSEFLANISHELRTPLQSIIGYTDVLTETLEEEGMDEYIGDLERILHNAQHLLTLINGILALAKIEAGRMDLELDQVSLQHILAQAEETICPLMNINHNEFETRLETCDQVLEIDSAKTLQILLNLLSNAAKFTQNGKIILHARHTPQKLSLSVEDTGIGISEQQQSIIFDPFRQVDGSTTRSFQGTGLGLSISQRFCRLMGGDITVNSRLGEGSTFTVSIPLPVQAGSRAYDRPGTAVPASNATTNPQRTDTDLI